jgi:hypothetical protein
MHMAEGFLTLKQWPVYHQHLCRLWREQPTPEFAYETHALASQRAEAFLRTIGKWEELP